MRISLWSQNFGFCCCATPIIISSMPMVAMHRVKVKWLILFHWQVWSRHSFVPSCKHFSYSTFVQIARPETMHDVNNDVIPSQLKDLFIPPTKIHSYTVIPDLQFPTTFIIKNQNLKLNENRFQELVQNCGMRYRYQLSSEPYQNSSLKGKFVWSCSIN